MTSGRAAAQPVPGADDGPGESVVRGTGRQSCGYGQAGCWKVEV